MIDSGEITEDEIEQQYQLYISDPEGYGKYDDEPEENSL